MDNKKPKIYRVTSLNERQPGEDKIAEMRLQKAREESKRLEDQRLEVLAKKRNLERRKQMFLSKSKMNGTVAGNFLSYNMAGQPVDVQLLTQFATIVPMCREDVRDPDVPVVSRASYLGVVSNLGEKGKAKSRKKTIPVFDELMEQAAEAVEKVNRKATVTQLALPRVYERLVPAVGVSFAEHGKKPKESTASVAALEGRMSRTEFNATITQLSRYSFLPEIVPSQYSPATAR